MDAEDERAEDLIERLQARVTLLEAQLGKRREGIVDRDEFLRRAFEDAPIGMALVGLDERIAEANHALCEMLGYTREQLLQQTVPAITHPDDVVLEAQPKGNMQDGRALTFMIEKRYLRADGSELLGRLSVSALYDEEAKPAYFIGQLEDVTRERAAERALREREAQFRALIENASEVFCVIDPSGRARYVSPNAREQLGHDVELLLGSAFVELLADECRSEYEAAFARCLTDPTAVMRLSLHLRDDAERREFDLVGHNRVDIAALAGVVVSLRDVSEQRALQAQLSQAQRLDSLGRLAAGVAHDFNNMLSVILGMTEFISQSCDADDPRREDLAAIEETAQRASALTRQLLTLGRKRLGVTTAVDLHELLEASARLLAKVLGDDIELVMQLDATRPHVVIEPTQFEQVVLNLASNARDAMPRGGRLRIRTRSIELSTDRPPLSAGRYFELSVEDSGTGISPEACARIFDPFYTTKSVGRGTGLGLATVYSIVQQAHGDIRVESELDHGTRFVICWPEQHAAAAPPITLPTREAPIGGHVLLVEDDDGMRSLSERVLTRAGYAVTAAAGPNEALAHVDAGLPFDVLVSDVVMPGMSGAVLYERVVARRGALPVVFMSGYAKALESDVGAHPGFIAKPFTPGALVSKVREQMAAGA